MKSAQVRTRLFSSVCFILAVSFIILHNQPAAAESECAAHYSYKIGTLVDDLFHVQGISITSDSIFITSVDKVSGSAFLWKYDRAKMKLIRSKNYAESFMIHPSGLQYDGRYLWLAIAVYSKESTAKVMKIDPKTLKPLKRFMVKDHIGLIATNGDGTIYGGNWDAKLFYLWNNDGKLMETRPNPASHGYQDCKVKGNYLICSGGGYVDMIRRDTWKIEKSFKFTEQRGFNNPTREGMDFLDGRFYFLPDDGAKTNIYVYIPEKGCLPEIHEK